MLETLIHGENADHRRALSKILREAPFSAATAPHDREEMQRRIYDQLRALNRWAGSGSALIQDRKRLFATLAFAASVSPSLFHVAQAHYGVCLSTIKSLGSPSEQLDEIIAVLDQMKSVAAILITEVGVGCSHLAVATRAVYEPKSNEFILNTPDKAACKIMANVALAGVAKTGVVYAQLSCGGKNHGLFPFVVQIRDDDQACAGVQIKSLPGDSVLGMDYSVVSFENVRIPRANWLRDTATIDDEGQLVDPLGSVDRRLVRSLGAGANASTATAVGAAAVARACIWTALRYAGQRRTMGQLGAGRYILEFSNQQNLLFGALAETYVISNLARDLVDGAETEPMGSSMATAPWAAINRKAALTKAVAVGGAAEAIQSCRRVCGAHGSLADNRFRNYEDLVVAYASAGGDNQLILIEIGRDLASKPCLISGDTELPAGLNDAASLRQLAAFEERRQYDRVTDGLEPASLSSEDLFATWNPRLPAAIDLARTHGRRLALERFLDYALSTPEDKETVDALATIYAVNAFGRSLSSQLQDRTLAKSFQIVMRSRDRLLDAFDLSPAMIQAPMAQDDYVSAYVEGLQIAAQG